MCFAARGDRLLLLDRQPGRLDALSDAIVARGADCPGTCPLDLASAGPEAFEDLTRILVREYGGLDVLIHAAARFTGLRPLDQVQPPEWLHTMQVNVNAAWLLSVTCLPLLRQSRRGQILFLLDDEERVTRAYWGAYGVSKVALRGMAKLFESELDGSGVQVLAYDPGPMRTPLRASAYLAEDPETQPRPEDAARRILELLERPP